LPQTDRLRRWRSSGVGLGKTLYEIEIITEVIDTITIIKWIVLLLLPFALLYALSVYGRILEKKNPDHPAVKKVNWRDLALASLTVLGGLFLVLVLEFSVGDKDGTLYSQRYGLIALLILFTGMFFGTLTLHASEHAKKSGVNHTKMTVTLIHLGSIISMYAITIWGFINLTWWITLVGFIAIYQSLRLVVRSSNWILFYRAIPLTGGLTIAITCGAWVFWAFV
jgi:hypothetical protein